MPTDFLREQLERFQRGDLSLDEIAGLLAARTATTRDATVDLDRATRCGYPEVIFGEGKTLESIRAIVTAQHSAGQRPFVTRVEQKSLDRLSQEFADGIASPIARTFRFPLQEQLRDGTSIVTAGTTDRPVAEEAAETLRWMGFEPEMICDVGVAGPHRLTEHVPRLRQAKVIVVAAGMEGALPSVVGGHVSVPVIAVPTSVGYGASAGGFAALFGMLSSCAANVCVVNIDAGFKAGYLAGLIANGKTDAEN